MRILRRRLQGNERVLGLGAEGIGATVLDFWRWAFRDLYPNDLRRVFAERLVAQLTVGAGAPSPPGEPSRGRNAAAKEAASAAAAATHQADEGLIRVAKQSRGQSRGAAPSCAGIAIRWPSVWSRSFGKACRGTTWSSGGSCGWPR